MKYFVILTAAASIAFAGCTPKLANRELGAEEKAWKSYLEPIYPGWEAPATLPPAVADRKDDAESSFTTDDGFGLPEPAKDSEQITSATANNNNSDAQNNDTDNSLTANSDEQSNSVRYDEYTVLKDESLSIIAKKVYGNGRKYYRILKANEELIKDANRIYPGMKLRIPRP